MTTQELKKEIARLQRRYDKCTGREAYTLGGDLRDLKRQLRDQKINEDIERAFKIEIGFNPVEIRHAFPVAYESAVHTEDRTWYGRLTYSGRHKKGSFVEDK